MNAIAAFLKAIPSAATSPLALIAYLAVIIAWVVLSYRRALIDGLGPLLPNISKNKRDKLLRMVLPGGDVPADYTADHYNANKNSERKLYALYAVLATVVIILAIAGYKAHNELDRSDGMIGEILDNPQTFRGALANLDRGVELVEGASEARPGDIPPNMSANDLGNVLDNMRMGNSRMNNSDALMKYMKSNSRGGRIQKSSGILNGAVAQLDGLFEKLDSCYREAACVNGSRKDELCKLTTRILEKIGNVNASLGDGVTVDTTDAASNFGNGATDPYFHGLSAPHIRSLHSQACG